ncbi:MAG: hypothetical protein AB4040_06840 [Synechococcus sp.]
MESRTKLLGPVMAMLALSSVSFSGFISPSLEQLNSEDRDSDTPTPAEQLLEGSSLAESETGSAETSSTATEDLPAQSPTPTTPDLSENASDTETLEPNTDNSAASPEEPIPVSFIDWLFIPIPDTVEAPSEPGSN